MEWDCRILISQQFLGRRAETPDKIPPEDPEETTAKKKIVLDLRRTKSTENLQATEKSEATEDIESKQELEEVVDLSEKPSEEQKATVKEEKQTAQQQKTEPVEPAKKPTAAEVTYSE